MNTAPPPLDGLVNLHKPVGISSAKALYRVRKLLGQRKSGHAGTLDPLASGVLLLCQGRGTRLVEQLMNLPKVYHAVGRLDVTSRTLDAGSDLEPVQVAKIPDLAEVQAAVARVEAQPLQTPPVVSALKVGGRRAYDLTRRGKPPVLSPRAVRVYWIMLERYCWPEMQFRMACGRGAYVRAVIRDIGLELGVGGCLTSLSRTCVGPFTLDNAHTLEEMERAPTAQAMLLPLEHVTAMIRPEVNPPPLRPARGSGLG